MLKNIFFFLNKYRNDFFCFNCIIFKMRIKFPSSRISSKCNIVCQGVNSILIGDNTEISKYTTLIVDKGPVVGSNAELRIGCNTYIGEYNNIRVAGGKITIGNNCLISQHITIVSSNHQIAKDKLICKQSWTTKNAFVNIEDDVWVGANSVILPGVTIHKGAVVAAGSIVTKDVPEYAVVAGNPAKVLRYRE